MKVLYTRKISKRMEYYQHCNKLNALIETSITSRVNFDGIYVKDLSYVIHHAKEFQTFMLKTGLSFSDDESIMATIILNFAQDVFSPMYGEALLPEEIFEDIVRQSKVFHKEYLNENKYLKNIHLKNQRLGHFALSHSSYSKYELMIYSSPINKYNGIMIPSIGTIDHHFQYPLLKENGNVWMSITPNEIFTMEQAIEEAHGHVLTLGCGMGYFAYMASEKESVKHVTIIENQPEVIKLFETIILPQFEHKEKITIIQADAFDYMESLEDGHYDFCFADIWISNNDIISYIKLKHICKKFSKMKMSYWIEDSMIATIMLYVYIIIQNEFMKGQMMFPPDNYREFAYLQNILKDAEITRPEHLDFYLDPKNIINRL